MHPAPSVIIFTTLSGLGFGMLVFLGLDTSAPTGWVGFTFFAIAYALAVGGLLSSTLHLGHPERAIKAFSQWRSSWLSREGIFAVATLVIMGLFAFMLVFFSSQMNLLGWIGAFLSILTIFATSMIYTQLKTVPRWNHWSPPILFMAYSITGGALLTGRVTLAMYLLPLLAVLQIVAWFDQDRREASSDSTLGSATGLGGLGKVRSFEQPHTGSNYLTKEMVFQVGRKHAATLKVISLALSCAIPLLLLLVSFNHFVAILAVLSHIAGVFVQRWLFFAEAKHVVGLYYGR
ncbi:MAG: DmsC/YnfH family molybdoenzyme membrane anchor subunit [Paracoccaceae bacterium]